jgi:outer membrane protein
MERKLVSILMMGLGLGVFCSPVTFSQDTKLKLSLGLKNVVDLAIAQSTSAKYVQNRNVQSYWDYRYSITRFRPQLMLNGDLPNYSHTTVPITQPDGSIEFKQVSNMLMNANLSLNQSIPFLGTNVYAASSVYRIENFINRDVSFSGTPVSVGFRQPVFSYNWMKWYRRTQPLTYEAAMKEYIESIEEISRSAAYRFFTFLRVQTNFNLAESNLKNSNDNLKIAETRRQLGTISENDFSRIRLSVINAQKALNTSRMELKNADFELKSYIQLDPEQEIELTLPLDIYLFDIDVEKALEETLANRKETPQFKRRLISADRDLEQAKRENSLQATLTGSYGMSNSAEFFGGVYDTPEKQRILRLSMSIPILDWGRSESRVKMAESERELVLYDVENDRRDFERQVVVLVEQFSLLKEQLGTSEEADDVSANGYKIALKKFQNGEISITDLNISLQERESAKRDYISSLREYWISYYTLRILTLYDFELGQKITYPNPMLNLPDVRSKNSSSSSGDQYQ